MIPLFLRLNGNTELEHWIREEREGRAQILSLGTTNGRGAFTNMTVLVPDELGFDMSAPGHLRFPCGPGLDRLSPRPTGSVKRGDAA